MRRLIRVHGYQQTHLEREGRSACNTQVGWIYKLQLTDDPKLVTCRRCHLRLDAEGVVRDCKDLELEVDEMPMLAVGRRG